MRVSSGTWGGERVVSGDQVPDLRNVDSRLHVARKERRPDEWNPCGSSKGYDVIAD